MEYTEYMETLKEQIQNKRARSLVAEEIRGHIEEQAKEYQAEGMSKEDAEREAVRQMETRHILPDAAHLNRRGFWELLEVTARPIVVSHTASAMLHPIARNLTDAQFCAVRERGGLVGLSLCPEHLGAPTLSRMIAHLEQFLSLGGEKTVALGCDLDGIEIPTAFGGIRVLETLYEQLLKRNYAESLADDIFFRNAYRFFTKQYI